MTGRGVNQLGPGVHFVTSSNALDFHVDRNIPSSTYGLERALTLALPSFSVDGDDFIADDPFSWQNLVKEPMIPYVFVDACGVTSGPSCDNLCGGSFGAMFHSLQTLHNCAVLPNVTHIPGIDAGMRTRLASQLGLLGGNATAAALHVTETLQRCFMAYCQSLPSCSIEFSELLSDIQNATQSNGSVPNRHLYAATDLASGRPYGSELIQSICDSFSHSVNSDVGGIGVLLSYLIQAGLSILILLGLMLLHYVLPTAHAQIARRNNKRTSDSGRRSNFVRSIDRQLSRLVVATVDFQKTQCFFVIFANIASLYIIKGGGLDPDTLGSILFTYSFMRIATLGSAIPITLILLALQLVDMLSWYLIVLSYAALALATTTIASMFTYDPSALDLETLWHRASFGGPPECSGFQPGILCMGAEPDPVNAWHSGLPHGDSSSGDLVILGFCFATITLLAADTGLKHYNASHGQHAAALWLPLRRLLPRKLKRSRETPFHQSMSYMVRDEPRQSDGFEQAQKYSPLHETQYGKEKFHLRRFFTVKSQNHDIGGNLWKALRLGAYIGALSFHIYLFYFYLSDAASLRGSLGIRNVIHSRWNFGQVIALSVWAPPIFEYVYLQCGGMKPGFSYKFRPPYKIIRQTDSEDLGSKGLHDISEIDLVGTMSPH